MKDKTQKQKILFICQNFWPENFRSTDVVNNLVNKGYEVEVLTSNPNYPEGLIYKNYKWYNFKTENYKKKFLIHRVPTFPRGKSSYLLILFNYIAFIIFGIFFGLLKLKKKRFDHILVFASSPIFQAWIGLVLKKFKKAKLIIWVQDLWPENLIALNIIKNKFIITIINYFTNLTYKSGDILLAQSNSFKKILKKRTNSKKIYYVPNYAEIFEKKNFKKIKNKKFTIVYAGNIGKAQNLLTLLKTARKLHKKDVQIKIFGDGTEFKALLNYKKKFKINNIIFYGKISKKKMYEEYKKSDALFLSLVNNKFLNFTIPAKLQTYFSIGKPIIASASGEIQELLKESKAGYCSKPENEDLLYKNILKLINLNYKNLNKLGKNSQSYFKNNFENKMITDSLAKILI